jgi:hypothetical protein
MKISLHVQLNNMIWPTLINQLLLHNHKHHINCTMPVLMSCYQVLILHFVIMACVLALRDKPHAFNYWVKGDTCIFFNGESEWKYWTALWYNLLLTSLLSDVLSFGLKYWLHFALCSLPTNVFMHHIDKTLTWIGLSISKSKPKI